MNIRRMYQFTISGISLLGICLTAASTGQAQWVQSGSNMYYTKGNISVGTTTPFGQFTIGNYTLGYPYGSFIFNQGAFTLKGLKNSDYFPYLEFRDENNARAAYLGWGSKSGKYLDWQFENGYNLAIKGGKVGIGTAPLTKFHLKGSTAQDAVLFIQPGEWNSAGDYGELRFGDTNHYIRGEYLTGMTLYDADKFQFMGGKVAIGSTNPVEKLDVNGNLMLRNSSNVGNAGASIHFTSYETANLGPKIRSALEFASGTASRSKLILSSYWNGYKDELTLMNGNVGIGTTNPGAKLEVKSGGNTFARLTSGSGSWAGMEFDGVGNIWKIERDPSGMMRFTEMGVGYPIVIKNGSGNIGIGTAEPASKLHVKGDVITIEAQNVADISGLRMIRVDENTRGHAWKFWHMNQVYGKNSLQLWEYKQDSTGKDCGGNPSDGAMCGVRVRISEGGNVAIYGKLEAAEVKISNSPAADFVFEPDYQLPSLSEIEQRVKADKHLPGIPSAKEIAANGGVSVGDMQAKQLQKIEELTLYMIEMNKQLSALQQENARLSAEVLKLQQARQ